MTHYTSICERKKNIDLLFGRQRRGILLVVVHLLSEKPHFGYGGMN